MSVYKRPGAETYSFDFQVAGTRFSGDTGQTDKRKAERVEAVERDKQRQLAKERKARGSSDLTLGEATARYMVEVGEHHKNWPTTLNSLEWLELHLGAKTRLADIGDADVARLVAIRRMDRRQVGRPENRTKRVSPATVNRTCTEPLRKVLLRARKVWKVSVQEIDWSQHMLAEPKERVREASIGEETAIMAELERGYDAAARFAFQNGVRRAEILSLVWSRVDFFGRQFTVIGKGAKERTIPMSDEAFDLLWRQRGHHDEVVFTFEAKRTRRHGSRHLVKGQRYPLTEAGLKTAFRRAVPDAGVDNFRFHDTRHTAATRVLRKSNLRVVQALLGHEDVKTTAKYAHAVAEDVRAALNAATPTKSPTEVSEEGVTALNSLGKSG